MRPLILIVVCFSLCCGFQGSTGVGGTLAKNEAKKKPVQEEDGYVKLEVKSKLRFVVLKGVSGEVWEAWTVGAGGNSFVLDFGDNKDWPVLAKKNSGKWVIVTGNMRKGPRTMM